MFKTLFKKAKTLSIMIAKKIILCLSRSLKIDLVVLAIRNVGILNSGNVEKTGEKFVIDNLLPKKITSDKPVIFDVGCNIGEYTALLSETFPRADIYSFEPNPKVFAIMKANLSKYGNVICENFGFGSDIGREKMFSYSKIENSVFGTLDKSALRDLYKVDDKIEEIQFSIDTIDNYCAKKNISHIDFLKIDTEGQELNVLMGARQMLTNNRINIIQFEFNNFNVYYRVFLKDFYDILNQYDFFRTHSDRLVPLGEYDTINEIFKFQNIVCIKK